MLERESLKKAPSPARGFKKTERDGPVRRPSKFFLILPPFASRSFLRKFSQGKISQWKGFTRKRREEFALGLDRTIVSWTCQNIPADVAGIGVVARFPLGEEVFHVVNCADFVSGGGFCLVVEDKAVGPVE